MSLSKKSKYDLPDIYSKQWLAITGAIITTIINIALISIIFTRNKGYSDIDLLVIILGWVIGGAVGTFASPINVEDQNRLTVIGQTVSAFFTGYVVSKLDRYVEMTLFNAADVQNDNWRRIGLFAAAMISVGLFVFVLRSYWIEVQKAEDVQSKLIEGEVQKKLAEGEAQRKLAEEEAAQDSTS